MYAPGSLPPAPSPAARQTQQQKDKRQRQKTQNAKRKQITKDNTKDKRPCLLNQKKGNDKDKGKDLAQVRTDRVAAAREERGSVARAGARTKSMPGHKKLRFAVSLQVAFKLAERNVNGVVNCSVRCQEPQHRAPFASTMATSSAK